MIQGILEGIKGKPSTESWKIEAVRDPSLAIKGKPSTEPWP